MEFRLTQLGEAAIITLHLYLEMEIQLTLGSGMTLEKILNDIDKILNDHQDELGDQFVSALQKHTEINRIIQDAAPYFKAEEPTKNSIT